MPRRKSESTDEQWARNFYLKLQSQIEPIPPNYRTTDQWSKLWGLSHIYTRNLLLRALRNGQMETRKFRVNLNGRIYPVPHYRIIHHPSRPDSPIRQSRR